MGFQDRSYGSYIPDYAPFISTGIACRVYNSVLSFLLISGVDSRVSLSLLFSRPQGRGDKVCSRHTSSRSCVQN